MFDHGESGDSAHPRPRLMEINVGPDLTAHSGWDDELRIHSRMMLEVAGLLASRCVRRSYHNTLFHILSRCAPPAA